MRIKQAAKRRKEKENKIDRRTDTLITHTHTRTATNAHLVLNDDLWGPWLKHFYDGPLTIIRPKLFPLRGPPARVRKYHQSLLLPAWPGGEAAVPLYVSPVVECG